MTTDEKLKDRYKALKNHKQQLKAIHAKINGIAKELQGGAQFRDHRDKLHDLALEAGEHRYWIQEIEKQIAELQEQDQGEKATTPLKVDAPKVAAAGK